jgi:hypothetical protein
MSEEPTSGGSIGNVPGSWADPAVAAGWADITASRGILFLSTAWRLNFGVRQIGKLGAACMRPTDLNKVWPKVTCTFGVRVYDEVRDNSAVSANGMARAYFRNLEECLIRHIGQAEMIVGCVAWLSNERILNALATVKHGVAIVVQKEDFLRPDLGADSSWKQRIRSLYGALRSIDRAPVEWPGFIGTLSLTGGPDIDPVRCVGSYNRDRRPAFARMHNKFLVFCRPVFVAERDNCPTFDPRPFAVWTGSFNFTRNASQSLENALFIQEPTLVEAYYREWEQIEAISEDLNWDSDWVQPEHRIGT